MLHTIDNGILTVTVNDSGCTLHSLQNKEGLEYLWQGDPRFWKRRDMTIFPYVARLTQGTYEMDGVRYRLPIHGFAPSSDFSLTERTGEDMTFLLEDNAETYAQYPRHFRFYVRFALQGAELAITYHVENRDERSMYFGIGGHPGFRVPLETGLDFSDYRFRFSWPCQPERIGLNEECFLDGSAAAFPLADSLSTPLCHRMFDDDAIVLQNMARQVTLESEKGKRSVTVTFPDMPYLGLWHCPGKDAPYVCIEPWASLPATAGRITVLEEQKDLIQLASGHTYKNSWSILCS